MINQSHPNYRAQRIASETMTELHKLIRVGMSEKDIADLAIQLMTQKGSDYWWYYGKGALILLGDRSIKSCNGAAYQPDPDNRVKENDIITIDLAPGLGQTWGDYARTLFMEEGKIAAEDNPRSEVFRQGLNFELLLHRSLMETCKPEMTCEEIFFSINALISEGGFENLDYRHNLGHSVEIDKDDRVYLELGQKKTFGEVNKPFTFEPHVRLPGSKLGFKRENIYYFDEAGDLICL